MRSLPYPALLAACLLLGCDDDPAGDAGRPTDASLDGGDLDAASTGDASRPDAGAPTTCGDDATEGAELCDGDSVTCASLSAAWSGGMASCRAGCDGYDVSSCTAAPRLWELVKPAERDARWSNARCNDGTPFDFLYRPGEAGTTTWIIHLQGGGFGDDVAFPTADRPPELTSTVDNVDGVRAPLPMLEHGIFGPEATNPDFDDAHHVLAHYCSSDFYTGRGTERRPVDGVPEGYYFAGRHNIRAMLEILAQRYGLDDADPTLRVLYGGESAGNIGATQTVNIAAERLPMAAATGRLRVFADGAYLVTLPDDQTELYWGDATVPEDELFTAALAYWDGEPLPACTATEPGGCLLGRGWYPAITDVMGLPVVVAMSTNDEVVLGLRGVCSEGCGPGGRACFPGCTPLTATEYADYRALHATEWSDLGVEWLFAWGSWEHTASMADNRWNGPPGATEPLRGLVADFFFDRAAPRQVFVNGAID